MAAGAAPDAGFRGASRPRIGVSSCLLGNEVRHDGGHKRDSFLAEELGAQVDWVVVCPEVEAGFGTPRPSMHLEDRDGAVRLLVTSDGRDVTEPMMRAVHDRIRLLRAAELDGFVLKNGSPSCGMERVPVRREGGDGPPQIGRGLFADALLEAFPGLPVEEEGRLRDPDRRRAWLRRVWSLHDRRVSRQSG